MTLTIMDIKDLKPSLEEFHKIDLSNIGNPDNEYSIHDLSQIFRKERDNCLEQDRPDRAKIFQIFWIMTSPMLSAPESPHNPYTPVLVINTERSPILDDLSDDDIEFLTEIISDIKNTALKARANDTLWLCSKPRNIKYAESAIIAYSNYPVNPTDFMRYGSYIAFRRAIYLSKILRKQGEGYLENNIDRLYNALINVHEEETAYSLKLSEILRENIKLSSDERRENIRQKLESIANECKHLNISQSYYEETIKWCTICRKETEIPRLYSTLAQRLETAILQDRDENQDMGAHTSWKIEAAIQILRQIPQKNRMEFHVRERLKQLRQLNDKACLALNERMTVISTDQIDITDTRQAVQSKITEKSLDDAVRILCMIVPHATVIALQESSKEIIKRNPLQYMITRNQVDSYGHKIVTIPPPNFSDLDAEESKPAVHYQMVVSYNFMVSYFVDAYIIPALTIINTEHHVKEEYIRNLVTNCSYISRARSNIWIKGLYAGFNQDYITSTHLLVPQLEHLIREILREKNIPTTHIDEENTETEMALGSLLHGMGESELEQFFGKDLYFELKTLLVDRSGPNLRNRVAHGLMEKDDFYSEPAIYLWWMCLFLVFVSGYNIGD